MMKILHVLNELKFSGAEIMYVAAANEFKSLGCQLYVVNTASRRGEYAPFFEKAGYKVFLRPYKKSVFNYKYMHNVISFLKKEKIDVVHIHRSDMRWCMSYCAWRAGCKAVYTFHNVFRSSWYSYLHHVWLRWSAKHIFGCIFQTISDSVCDNEKEYYHNKTIKIYNWYDSNRFSPANKDEKNIIRNKLNIPSDALVLISVGGCSPIKRHSDIIKALPVILKKYPDTVYLHLGKGDTLNDEIQLARKLKVEKNIRFEGNKNNVREFLIASDIYLMPSKFEGISITAIEAMACKIPEILYNVPGLRDFNKKRECAYLIEENCLLLAKAVTDLFSDKNKMSFLSENGKKFVNENFCMKDNVKKIFELYK